MFYIKRTRVLFFVSEESCCYLLHSLHPIIETTIIMLFLTLSSLLVASVSALSASSIDSCPTLEPRSQAPTNISDLRPDDIKVVAAMGDRYVIIGWNSLLKMADGITLVQKASWQVPS